MLRKLSIVLAIGLLVLVVAPLQAQQPTVITLAVSDFLEDTYEPIIARFEELYPDIQVELITYSGFDVPVTYSDDIEAYLDDWEAYVSSADVLPVTGNALTVEPTLAGYLLDLTPLVFSDPDFDTSDFYNALWNAFQWDGGLWAVPVSGDAQLLYYDPVAFDEAGLAYPSASWTVDDFVNAVQALTQIDASGEVTRPGFVDISGNLAPLLLSFVGAPVYDETTLPNLPNLDNADIESVLNAWQSLEEGGWLETPSELDFVDVPLIFGQGFIGGGPGQNVVERFASPLPGNYTPLSISGYAISAGTQHPEAAYTLLEYLSTSPDVANTSFNGQAARRSLQNVEPEVGGGFRFGGPPVSEEVNAVILEALDFGLPTANLRYATALTDALDLMTQDNLDAATALEEVEQALEDRLTAVFERAAVTQITVAPPVLAPTLAPGEIVLRFGATANIIPFPNEEQWLQAAQDFAELDPEVGFVDLETSPVAPLEELTTEYDCFYTPNNQVADGDLSLLRNIDPLLASDPAYDPYDLMGNVLEQLQVENQTWGYPLTIQPQVLQYDADWFDIAGVAQPLDGWTSVEFEEALYRLADALEDGVVPFQPSFFNPANDLLALVAAYGGLPVDYSTDPMTINFTDPVNVNAIREVLDLVKDGLIQYDGLVGRQGGALTINTGGENQPPITVTSLNGFGGFGGGGGFIVLRGSSSGESSTEEEEMPRNLWMVTYPQGSQYAPVSFGLGAGYISASSQYAEPCYRFLSYLAGLPDLFDGMPARYSQLSNPAIVAARDEATINFYTMLADLLAQPNALIMPQQGIGGRFSGDSLYWLYRAMDRYVNDELATTFEDELAQAEQFTREYLSCTENLPAFVPGQGDFGEFRQSITACATDIDPTSADFFQVGP
ncbi:MAG: hypothetical protein OHK0046_39510 [Anaerolineae bacterium]